MAEFHMISFPKPVSTCITKICGAGFNYKKLIGYETGCIYLK